MKNFVLLSCIIIAFITTGNVYAQDAQIVSISNLNTAVHTAIEENRLFVHRVSLNSTTGQDKIWPGFGKYKDNLTFYFDMENGRAILKKVIVTSDIIDRKAYADYMYDASGNLAMCFEVEDFLRPTADRSRYYFFNNKMLQLTVNEDTKDAASFTTDDVTTGVNTLEKGRAYKQLFDALVGVHLLAK